MIEFDELKRNWTEYDRKLDVSIRLNRQILKDTRMKRTRSALQRMAALQAVGAVVDLAVIGAIGSFIADHIAIPRFALPAIALDICAIGLLIAKIIQIGRALQVEYDSPVTVIQKRLEALRVWRIRCTTWTLLVSPLIWTPLLIVSLKAFFGIDAYNAFGGGWLVANLLPGVAVIPLAIWFSKAFGARMDRSPIIQRMMNDLAGHNLKVAIGSLAKLSEFERE